MYTAGGGGRSGLVAVEPVSGGMGSGLLHGVKTIFLSSSLSAVLLIFCCLSLVPATPAAAGVAVEAVVSLALSCLPEHAVCTGWHSWLVVLSSSPLISSSFSSCNCLKVERSYSDLDLEENFPLICVGLE